MNNKDVNVSVERLKPAFVAQEERPSLSDLLNENHNQRFIPHSLQQFHFPNEQVSSQNSQQSEHQPTETSETKSSNIKKVSFQNNNKRDIVTGGE